MFNVMAVSNTDYRLSMSKKNVSYNLLSFLHGRPSKLGPSGDKIIPFSKLSTRYKPLSLLLSCTNEYLHV